LICFVRRILSTQLKKSNRTGFPPSQFRTYWEGAGMTAKRFSNILIF